MADTSGIDRGGIQYTIRADVEGLDSLGKFKAEIASLQREVDALKRELSSRARTSRQRPDREAARQKEREAAATQRHAEATEELARASAKEAQGSLEASRAKASETARTDELTRAKGRLSKEVRRLRAAQERLAAAKQFFSDDRLRNIILETDAVNRRIAAERRLAAAQDLFADKSLQDRIAQARFIERINKARQSLLDARQDATSSQIRQLQQEEAAVRRILAAEKQLAQERQFVEDPRLRELTAQAAALQRIRAIEARLQAARQAATDPRLQQLTAEEAAVRRILAAEKRLAQERQFVEDPRLRELTAQAAALQRIRSIEARLQAARQAATDPRLQQLAAEEEALRRINRVEKERQVRAILQAQGRDPRGFLPGEAPVPAQVMARARPQRPEDPWRELRREMAKTEGTANRISFTFRRLFGILAAFTAARMAVQGFNNSIRQTVQFMSRLEQAELGVASLITATSELTSPTGQMLQDQEKLIAAQKISREQLRKLRIDALQTAGTFEDLAEAFQVAIAPGVQAGLDIDQIRQFTVRISQAAAAIGLPQNQLAEEIRSILSGTISIRHTRIAAALGITNEDIRRAKEAGRLIDFLTERFKAFGIAGEASLSTFAVLAANTRDALLQIGEVGLRPFFDEMKGLLQGVLDQVRVLDAATGQVMLNPRAVAIVRAIGEGLASAVQEARNLSEAITFEQALGSARALSAILATGAEIVSGIATGILRGMNTLRTGFAPLFRVLNFLTGGLFDNAGLSKTVALITQVFLVYTTINTLIRGTFRLLVAQGLALVDIAKTTATWAANMRRVQANAAGAAQSIAAASTASAAGTAAASAGAALLLRRFLGVIPVIGSIATLGFLVYDALNLTSSSAEDLSESASDTLSTLEEMPASVSKMRQSLSQNAELMEEFRKSLQQAKADLKETIRTLGLEGNIREQMRALLSAEEEAREKLKNLDSERLEIEQNLLAVQQRRDKAEDRGSRILQFGRLRPDEEYLSSILKVYDRIQQTQERIALITERRAQAEKELAQANAENNLHAYREQASIVLQLNKQLEEQNDLLEEVKSAFDYLVRTGKRLGGIQELQVETALEIIDARNQEADLTNQLFDIAEDRRLIEQEINKILAVRLRTLAEQDIFQTRRANAIAAAELAAERRIREARSRLLSRDQLALVEAQEEINVLRTKQQIELEASRIKLSALQEQRESLLKNLDLIQLIAGEEVSAAKTFAAVQQELEKTTQELFALEDRLRTEQHLKERESLEKSIASLEFKQAQLEALLALEEQIAEQQEAARILRDVQNDQLEEALAKIQHAQQILERPVAMGFLDGLIDAVDRLPTLYEGVFLTISDTVVAFRDFVADAITDAFDPTKKVDLRNRFAQFLTGIASQIVSTLVSVALTTLALNAIPGFAEVLKLMTFGFGGRYQGGPVGFHRGGSVKRAVGMDRGGRVPNRPSPRRHRGLHPRDTVPIWADPREWVIRASSVSKYGDDVMGKINAGVINPYALRALAGMQTAPSSPSVVSKGPGMVLGGPVARARPAALPAPPSARSGDPIAAYIVASESAAERILAGGRNAFLDFLEREGFRRS